MSIRLTDSELTAVFTAARPIAVERRDAYLREVAALLSGCVEVGPGDVHRAIVAAQRMFFEPPDAKLTRFDIAHDLERLRLSKAVNRPPIDRTRSDSL